jgi:hypothetical protein
MQSLKKPHINIEKTTHKLATTHAKNKVKTEDATTFS